MVAVRRVFARQPLAFHQNGLSKEPWLYGDTVEPIAEDFMRLRHRLLPYLYTANIRTAKFGEPIVAPMYYGYDEPFAYDAKNQYIFGGELLVAPVVNRAGKDGMSVTKVWFPAGKWTNFFTGEVYEGEKLAFVKSALDEFPVYAKEGAIIPLIAEREGNSVKFDEIEVRVFKGNGEYTMYDEKGSIYFKVSTEGKVSKLEILPSEDCGTRKSRLRFTAVSATACVAGMTSSRAARPLSCHARRAKFPPNGNDGSDTPEGRKGGVSEKLSILPKFA